MKARVIISDLHSGGSLVCALENIGGGKRKEQAVTRRSSVGFTYIPGHAHTLHTHTKRCILILKDGGAYAFGKLLGIHVSIENEPAKQMNLCFLSVLFNTKIYKKI